MPEQLIVFQKFYDFVLLVYPIINRIPQSHRLILGRELEELSLKIIISIINANHESIINRKNIQKEISNNIDILRILFRLTKDLKFISINQYEIISKKLNEIGKLLYCWSKI